jgi:serine phosphatase RsbU (regulator of sigma subunit)
MKSFLLAVILFFSLPACSQTVSNNAAENQLTQNREQEVISKAKSRQRKEDILISALCVVLLVVAGLIVRKSLQRSKQTIKIKGKKAEIMSSIYKSILSAESIEESIFITIKQFKNNFSFARVSITLFDFERGTFIPYGMADLQNFGVLKNGASFPLQKFGSLQFLKEHKTYLVRDIRKKELISESDRVMMEQEGILSYLLCPLIGKGELIGSLNFSALTVNAFSPAMISFCEEVAKGFAISLHQYYLQEKISAINDVLHRKEKNITDSINYAKTIQQARLPSMEQIRACVPDSFVLFKPKDIVSGDFYFFRKNKGVVFIAAADCTGHGVPGALMSMICSENLEDAVSQSSDTSQVLSLVNRKVKHSLQQSDHHDSSRDGMDIAFCTIDAASRIVKFAGANRPAWIIRNGQKAVEEIKGTKCAIGGYTDDKQQFDTHWIKLHAGDTFYLFTDGYADTFGGNNKKKLMTKRFKDILVGIQDKSMEQQRAYLDDFIEKWKDGLEQVDDILVIGVRL